MVTVPFFCPDVPAMTKNPAFFYYPDHFRKPNPFQPDIIVSVDEVMDKKLDGLGIMISQFYEGGANGSPALVPDETEQQKKRHQQVRDGFRKRQQSLTEKFHNKLADWYSPERVAGIKHVEAFEICEYGSQPDKNELKRLFPFFGKPQ